MAKSLVVMGDTGDAFMRNQNAAVQARTKAPQNRSSVVQLKLESLLLLTNCLADRDGVSSPDDAAKQKRRRIATGEMMLEPRNVQKPPVERLVSQSESLRCEIRDGGLVHLATDEVHCKLKIWPG